MKKISRDQLRMLFGGKNLAVCGVECDDGNIHNYDCGKRACNTTQDGLVDCYNSDGSAYSTNNNPCR